MPLARAAKAVKALAEAVEEAVAPHIEVLLAALLAELPGRLWDGKEAVLEAIAALALACKYVPQ
eukprot:1951101-Pyramimonas_sp.AAC.1